MKLYNFISKHCDMIKIFTKHLIVSLLTAKHFSKQKILIFFRIFNIRFFFAFNLIRNFFSNKKFSQKNIRSFYFNNKISSFLILKDLINNGYNFNLKLNNKIIKQISNSITSNNTFLDFKSKETNKNFLKDFEKFKNLNEIYKKSVKYKVPHVSLQVDLNKSKIIKKLATSNFLLHIAKNYLGNKKILIASQCYISNPIKTNKQIKKDLAQYFHYDNDFKKFLKVFIYLSNVDENSGPHIFVRNTHKIKKFKHIVSERIDDAEILKSYPKKDIKIFKGSKGSTIIEDTFGLHKGLSPKNKTRLMLILIYGQGDGIGTYRKGFIIKNKNELFSL